MRTEISRKEFLRFTVTFVGAGVLAACSSESSGGGATPTDGGGGATCGANGAKNGTISSNHGHALSIPKDDFASPTQHTYSIRGAATHDHQITLSAAQMQQLLAGTSVTVTSTTDSGHSHDVQVLCA